MDIARPIAVTNTTPMIALTAIGCLPLLAELFVELVVPFEVWGELNDKANAPEPTLLRVLPNVRFLPTPARLLSMDLISLHEGERDAISIALSLPGAWVLLDEAKARKIAAGLGLRVVGTLGIMIEAKRRGLIPEVRPLVAALRATGFHLGDAIVEAALRAAGE